MTQGSATIAAVKVATLQAPLPVPVVFGNWVMRHREFAICGVVATDGTVGVSFCYTRDGPIQALVERLVAPHYAGKDPARSVGALRRCGVEQQRRPRVGHRPPRRLAGRRGHLGSRGQAAGRDDRAAARRDAPLAPCDRDRGLPADDGSRRAARAGERSRRAGLAALQAADRADPRGDARAPLGRARAR